MRINESFNMERNSTLPRRLRSNQGDYIQCYQQRECSRIVVPIDHGRSRSFGSRSQQLVEDSEYPGTFHTNYSMTVMRPINARPSVISVRDYMEEDVHPDQPLARSDFLHRGEYPGDPSYISYHPDEEMVLDQQSLRSHVPERSRYDSPSYEVVVPDQPISRSSYPERRGRYSNTLVPDQPISQSSNHERRGRYSDSLVLDQPISRSNYPGKRRRYYDSPSSYDRTGKDVAPYSRSNFHERRRFSENSRSYSRYRRESTEYEDRYEEARRPRKYKRRDHEYHAKHWEGTKERDLHGQDRSPNMRSRVTTSNRSFKKPMINYAKFGGTPEKQARHTNSSASKSPSYHSEGTAPASVSDSAKVLETKFSKDNEEVDSTNKLAAKLSKDNAESNLTKKPETMPVNDNAGTDLSKKLVTKSSRDDAEAKLAKKLETKSSKDNAGTNLTKKLEIISSKDNAEANATKELAARPSKDDAEANATKELATKPSKDDAKVNVTKDLAKKSFNDNAEAKVTKKPATNPSLGNAEAKLTKDLGTKLSNDNAEANLTKELGMKLSKDNAEGNLTKELGMKLSEDNAEGNLTKELGMKLSEDNAEANLKKELRTKLSQDNSEANLTRKLEPKPSNSDKKEVEREKKNSGSEMMELKANFSAKKDASSCYIKLKKDGKFICYAKCTNPPIQVSSSWNVDIVKMKTVEGLPNLPNFPIFPSFMPSPEKNESDQKSEWNKFFNFLHGYNKVATVKLANMKIHVFPSQREPNVTDDGLYFSHAMVAYDLQELCDTSVDQRHATPVMHKAAVKAMSPLPGIPLPSTRLMLEDEVKNPLLLSNSPRHSMKNVAFESDAYLKGSSSAEKATCSSISKCHEHNSLQLCSTKEDVAAERNFVTDPSYLKTLGHAHSGWIFGAIAELVDNSRDARASRLEIAVETIFDKTVGSEIPMLSVMDDGVGMNHQEILRMISFGHKVLDEDNQDCIGRFGVGFKTGSMRLGRDALVLTQTTHSRSVAFLSQSLNEGKDNVEIPVVSYCRQAQCMDIDTSVQSEALAKYNLNAMKQFSPFNEYLIGEKAGLFRGNTGTQIYIWNLDKWGAEYTLEWQAGLRGGSTFHQGDIYIRSRRVRKRPGQTSRKVSLDYSLRSYLEVIFLEPRMKIYVQGSLVRSRPLAKSLNNTAHHNGEIMGKQVRLTLGRCQIEWDEANCGIFLYWHGRLIEAYKRVGGMVHSADMGRGVIGVVEVTELMDDGNGGVWVHNNKQGFQDCEPYALLEEWLGKQADEYWDKFFDPVQLKKEHARYKPDNEWVQCDKCRKWRLLNADFDSMNLPKDWFCYMEPFNGRCEMPEQKPGHGVITVELKRSSGHDPSKIADSEGLQIGRASPIAEAKGEDKSTQPAEGDEKTPTVKKARRGKGQDKSTPPAEDDEEIPVIKRRKRGVQNARKYIQD